MDLTRPAHWYWTLRYQHNPDHVVSAMILTHQIDQITDTVLAVDLLVFQCFTLALAKTHQYDQVLLPYMDLLRGKVSRFMLNFQIPGKQEAKLLIGPRHCV